MFANEIEPVFNKFYPEVCKKSGIFASLAFLTNGNINEIAEILQESTNTITELFNKDFGPDVIQCF